MSWYKKLASSFIDTVGVETYSESHALVIVGAKKYLYTGTDGYTINNQITKFRSMKNKFEAGKLCSQYLKRLMPYLQQAPAPEPKVEPNLFNQSE